MRLSRKQLRKIILKEMEDPTLPPEPVIPAGVGRMGDDMPGRPDEELTKSIFYHMENFLREFGPIIADYGGSLGRVEMGHVQKLAALTNKLRGCALGEVQEPWTVCAAPVLNLTKFIAQSIKAPFTDRYLRAPAGQGGLIELLQLSIDQAS